MTQFNPNEHLTKLKGKDYLEVKWRLVWFRDQYPSGEIRTEMIHLDLDKGLAIFKATVSDGKGGTGVGHGSESSKDFGDYIEKAETKAIGRALATLGFGTQFAPELEEGNRIVDSAVSRTRPYNEAVTGQNGQTSNHTDRTINATSRSSGSVGEALSNGDDEKRARLNTLYEIARETGVIPPDANKLRFLIWIGEKIGRKVEVAHLTEEDLGKIEQQVAAKEGEEAHA